MNQPTESVIRKIQNLMKVSTERGATEAEAQTAMALAQQLLAKYNMELSVVQDTHVAGGTVEEKRVKEKLNYSAAYQWQRDLWDVLAEANFCMHWVVETSMMHEVAKREVRGKRHVLVGREGNVMVVRMMAEYLIDTMQRLMPYKGKEHLSNAAHNWRQGCVDRLAERIRAQAKALRTDDSAHDTAGSVAAPGTAMVVRGVAEQEQAKNYDIRHGDGAWARKVAYEAGAEQRMAEWEAKQAERLAQAEANRLAMLAAETPSERAKRLAAEDKEAKRQARDNAKWYERYYKQQERAARKVDWSARNAGSKAAENINLSQQITAGSKTKNIA